MQSRVVLAAASGRKAAAAGESINGKPIVTQKSALPHPCNACHKHERQSRNICVLTCFLYMSNAGHFTSSAKAKKVWNSRLLYLVICWFLPKVKIESHDLREFVWTNSLRQIQFLIHFWSCCFFQVEQMRFERSEKRVCVTSLWRVKSVSKLYLQVDLICQIDRSRVRFPAVAAFIFFPFFYSVPPLFHSNFQSWQMRSLPTLDPYVF